MSAVERAEQRVTLLKEAVALVTQLRANEAERGELLDQRDGKCKALRQAGASISELQEVLGISRSRVQQILRGEQAGADA